MLRAIFLDSSPLSTITKKFGSAEADACRAWAAGVARRGVEVIVPEIIDYELRRELLRAGKTSSVRRLDNLARAPQISYLPLDTRSVRLAAELWSDSRQRGLSTAPPDAIDADVILAAQALTSGIPPSDFVVATSNLGHLSRFVNAELWERI